MNFCLLYLIDEPYDSFLVIYIHFKSLWCESNKQLFFLRYPVVAICIGLAINKQVNFV